MKQLSPLLLLLCFCVGCVSTSLPSLIIPKHARDFDSNLSIGYVGAQADVQYAVSSRWVVGGAYQYAFGPGPVQYGELRLGAVLPGERDLLTAAFGHGKFDLWLRFPLGSINNSVYYYYGHCQKASLSWNHQHPFKKGIFGVLTQVATLQGTGNGVCATGNCYNQFYNRKISVPLHMAALMYLRWGKKQRFSAALGGAWSPGQGSVGEPEFVTQPFLLSFGFNLFGG